MAPKKLSTKKGDVSKTTGKPKAKAKVTEPKSPSKQAANKKDKEKPKSPAKADSKPVSAEKVEKARSTQPVSPKPASSPKRPASPKGPASPKAQPGAKATAAKPEPSIQEVKKELSQATQKRIKLADELQAVEKQIFELETRYLENSHPLGNALKGYEGLLSQGAASTRRVLVRQEDRLFSNSSLSGLSRGEKMATGASGLYAFK